MRLRLPPTQTIVLFSLIFFFIFLLLLFSIFLVAFISF